MPALAGKGLKVPDRYAYLGPEGTFTEAALAAFDPAAITRSTLSPLTETGEPACAGDPQVAQRMPPSSGENQLSASGSARPQPAQVESCG